ncbi:MAG: iron-containing alcohol dehydrogenase [Clostridia bacterium]
MNFNYYIPTRILFGKGSVKTLGEQTLPGKTALIVTTNGKSVKKFGYLDTVIEQLEKQGVKHFVFDKILPNPIKEHVMQGSDFCKANGVDFVIGLGGGSAIDASKAIAVMATNDGDYWDYISGGTGKGMPVKNDPLPIVAITTTAGTGTEADPWTVTTKTETNEKIGFGYEKTFPVLSIVDPELMLTVPTKLTAYQGFDALFHSTEGYLNITNYVMSDMYALKAIELIGKSLAKAVSDGSDIDARGDVALANTLAGMVESTSGCTSEHSIAHAISAYHSNFEHGAALTSICVEYYTYIAKSGKCEQRLIDMAKALGKTDASCGMDFVDALSALKVACDVDDIKMSEYGMKFDELEKYALNARDTMGGLFTVDPIEIDHNAVVSILEKSFK